MLIVGNYRIIQLLILDYNNWTNNPIRHLSKSYFNWIRFVSMLRFTKSVNTNSINWIIVVNTPEEFSGEYSSNLYFIVKNIMNILILQNLKKFGTKHIILSRTYVWTTKLKYGTSSFSVQCTIVKYYLGFFSYKNKKKFIIRIFGKWFLGKRFLGNKKCIVEMPCSQLKPILWNLYLSIYVYNNSILTYILYSISTYVMFCCNLLSIHFFYSIRLKLPVSSYNN